MFFFDFFELFLKFPGPFQTLFFSFFLDPLAFIFKLFDSFFWFLFFGFLVLFFVLFEDHFMWVVEVDQTFSEDSAFILEVLEFFWIWFNFCLFLFYESESFFGISDVIFEGFQLILELIFFRWDWGIFGLNVGFFSWFECGLGYVFFLDSSHGGLIFLAFLFIHL